MGGDGRDALPGQKYRELGGEEGMLGGSQDTAHDCGSLGTGRDNPSALKGRHCCVLPRWESHCE